jgi:hypothetical protein
MPAHRLTLRPQKWQMTYLQFRVRGLEGDYESVGAQKYWRGLASTERRASRRSYEAEAIQEDDSGPDCWCV